MYSLDALGGALSVVGWGALNTCGVFYDDGAVIQGDFRNRHAGCHNIADVTYVLGGKRMRELYGGLFVVAYILCTGAGIVGVATGLNALSHHAACTVWWSLIATVVIALCSSLRKLQTIGWLTWAGFVSIFTSVMIVVIAVTTLNSPAAAPQTGDYDLGHHVIAHPTFIAGMTATATVFISSSGSSAFLPVIAEMKNPKDHRKALFVCAVGNWVASPSLGSAGKNAKMVAYGIGMVGLIVSAVILLARRGEILVRPLPSKLATPTSQYYGTLVYLAVRLLLPSVFVTIAGTYATVQNIIDAYATGTMGSAFSCANNSNSSQTMG